MAYDLKTREGFDQWCRNTPQSVVFNTMKQNLKGFEPESYFADLEKDASPEEKEARMGIFIDEAWKRFETWMRRNSKEGPAQEKSVEKKSNPVVANPEAKKPESKTVKEESEKKQVPAKKPESPVKASAKKSDPPTKKAKEPEKNQAPTKKLVVPAAPAKKVAVVEVPADPISVEIKIKDLILDPENVRHVTDDANMESFIANIAQVGVIQPVIVRPDNTLIIGYRRVMAAKKAGLKTVPYIVQDLSDKQIFFARMSENVQREDLSPVDLLRALRQGKELGCKGKELAAMFKLHDTQVSSFLRVTDPDDGVWPKTLDYINEHKRMAYSISALVQMQNMGNKALWDFVNSAQAEKVTAAEIKEHIAGKLDKPDKKKATSKKDSDEEDGTFDAEPLGTDPASIKKATVRVVMTHLAALDSLLTEDLILSEDNDIDQADAISGKLIELINRSMK